MGALAARRYCSSWLCGMVSYATHMAPLESHGKFPDLHACLQVLTGLDRSEFFHLLFSIRVPGVSRR